MPIFVAQGHVARTTISCDGGQSWINERSDDDALVCWVPPNNEPDCDHHPGAGRGVAIGNGWIVATFGWGPPGGVRRSQDGVSWETVIEGTTFGGVAYGNGVFMAAANEPRRSLDDGASWETLAPIGLGVNIRRFAFVDHDGGKFVISGDNATVAISSDGGDSWQLPTLPAGCGANIQTDGGIAAGNGTLLILGGDGIACSSTDGVNWTSSNLNSNIGSALVFNGSEFMAWNNGTAFSSPDGQAWTETPMNQNYNIGPAAYGNGAYVAVRGGWQTWYTDQEFYRSDDGINWTLLPAGNYVGGHPMRAVTFGQSADSFNCP